MGDDEDRLTRLWREKRGDAEPDEALQRGRRKPRAAEIRVEHDARRIDDGARACAQAVACTSRSNRKTDTGLSSVFIESSSPTCVTAPASPWA